MGKKSPRRASKTPEKTERHLQVVEENKRKSDVNEANQKLDDQIRAENAAIESEKKIRDALYDEAVNYLYPGPGVERHKKRSLAAVFQAIQALEQKGYFVELNPHVGEYAVFFGSPALDTYIGYFDQPNPSAIYLLDDSLDIVTDGRGANMGGPAAELPNRLTAQYDKKNFVTPVHPGKGKGIPDNARVKHSLSNCGYTVMSDKQAGNEVVYYRGGQFAGYLKGTKGNQYLAHEDNVRIISVKELFIVWNPHLVELHEIETFTNTRYYAYYLEQLKGSAVWTTVSVPNMADRLRFLGFANSLPADIDPRKDYLCLFRTVTQKLSLNLDYPMGVPLYPWRHIKKPLLQPGQQRPDLGPLRARLDTAGVVYECQWSKENGAYHLVAELGLGGLVFPGNIENLFRWDDVFGYLVEGVTVQSLIDDHLSNMEKERRKERERKKKERQKQRQAAKAKAAPDVPTDQAEAKETRLVPLPGAFGRGTFFVGRDQAHPLNMSTWPTIRQQPQGVGYLYDSRSGNLEVKHDKTQTMVATSRFYNTQKRRNCYIFSVSKPNGDNQPPTDHLVWNFEDAVEDEESLFEAYKYKRIESVSRDNLVPSSVDLNEVNTCKLITTLKGKGYYLSIIQATDSKTNTEITGMKASAVHFLAIGAANQSSVVPIDITGISNQHKGENNLVIQSGSKLEEALFGTASLCETVDRLARTTESYGQCTMWKLSRDEDGKSTTLPIRDIGVRELGGYVEKFSENKSQAEKNYLKQLKLVRCFVALVPDAKDGDELGESHINVVSAQHVHPVENELHIVYILHKRGKFYSQQIYSNVILLEVHVSDSFMDHFVQLCDNPTSAIKPAKKPEKVNPLVLEATAIKVRGYYNEFWKNVCDPFRKPDMDEEERKLYQEWQHFYQHDFLGSNYLASPLGSYEPEQFHVVSMADMMYQNFKMNLMYIGRTENRGEKVFLSGAFDKSQSFIGSPFVEYRHYLVQVEVPDEDKTKCVIFDFDGINRFSRGADIFDTTSELKTKAVFSEMSRLVQNEGSLPQRLYFPDIQVNRSRKTFSFAKSQAQEDGGKKVLKKCPPQTLVNISKDVREQVKTDGCIQINLFYFVSHVGIAEKVKVGVANVPFNCRAFVTHSESLCSDALKLSTPDDQSRLTKTYKTTNKKETTDRKYPVRGCIWKNDEPRVVGIVDGNLTVQSVAQACFVKDKESPKPTQVAFISQCWLRGKEVGERQRVPTGDKVLVYSNLSKTEHHYELTHFIRQISSPTFDVVKGYPVHGFCRQSAPTDKIVYDPVFYDLFDKFYEFWTDANHPKHKKQQAAIETQRNQMKLERKTKEDRLREAEEACLTPDVDDVFSLAAILSASAALFMLL
ncbi:hypothetical protein HDE_03538 [Halotydeus destructor]|nr:hypothetical protein HDE_03538 [Halotydeus destructor]